MWSEARLDEMVRGSARITPAIACASVAAYASVAAATNLAAGTAGAVVLWCVAIGAAVGVVVCVVAPTMLSGRRSTPFAWTADVVLAVALLVLADPRLTFAGCIVFALVSGFAAIHVSLPGLSVHLVATTAFVCVSAGRMVAVTETSVTVAVIGTSLWLWAIVGVPVAVRRIWADTSLAAERADHDPLTGLLNRAGLERAYRALAARVCEPQSGMVVVVIDLDQFKTINDRYGHHVGDAVLVEVADHLGAHFGDRSALARCGGEEFAVLAVGPRWDLTRLVTATPTTTSGVGGPPVAMSVGAVHWDPRGRDGGLSRAMDAADHAMYTAKRDGGNRVRIGGVRESVAGPVPQDDVPGPGRQRYRRRACG